MSRHKRRLPPPREVLRVRSASQSARNQTPRLPPRHSVAIIANVCPLFRIQSGPLFVMCASRQARVSIFFVLSRLAVWLLCSFCRLVIGVLCSLAPNLIRVQNIVHCVGCHPTKGHNVNLTLRVYFAPTNFTLSAYLASKHSGDSACFDSKNLRDSACLLKILFKVDFICTIQKKAVPLHAVCVQKKTRSSLISTN